MNASNDANQQWSINRRITEYFDRKLQEIDEKIMGGDNREPGSDATTKYPPHPLEPLAEPLKPLELLPVSPCRHDGHRPIRPEWLASPESSSSPPVKLVASAPPAPDPVNHPAHYTSSQARCQQCWHQIECIDVVEHLPFCIGSILKYLWRCDLKHESPLEDLRKARWYLDREIDRRTRQQADQQRGGEA